MGKFRNLKTGIVVSVDDAKDDRFDTGWESAEKSQSARKAPAKKAASSKSED